jgi:hypothetical protein
MAVASLAALNASCSSSSTCSIIISAMHLFLVNAAASAAIFADNSTARLEVLDTALMLALVVVNRDVSITTACELASTL